jgi:hypothetical protein
LFTFFTFAHILDLVVSYSFKLRRLIFCFQCYIVKTIDTFQTAALPPFPFVLMRIVENLTAQDRIASTWV